MHTRANKIFSLHWLPLHPLAPSFEIICNGGKVPRQRGDPVGRSMASQFFRRALIDGSTLALDGRPYNIAEALAAMCPMCFTHDMSRVRPFNLGWCKPSKVVSTHLFSAICRLMWLKLRWTYDLGCGQTSTEFQPNRSTYGRKGVFDATYEGKILRPKFKWPPMGW